MLRFTYYWQDKELLRLAAAKRKASSPHHIRLVCCHVFYKVRHTRTRFSGKRFAGDGDTNMPQAGPYDRRLHVVVGEQGPCVEVS